MVACNFKSRGSDSLWPPHMHIRRQAVTHIVKTKIALKNLKSPEYGQALECSGSQVNLKHDQSPKNPHGTLSAKLLKTKESVLITVGKKHVTYRKHQFNDSRFLIRNHKVQRCWRILQVWE